MIDLKYHIASLVAVFLALGLGILVGITMVGDEALIQEQKNLIDRLEQDFLTLREQNTLVQKEITDYKKSVQYWQSFSKMALPFLIKGRLEGCNLAIIQTGSNDLPPYLLDNLEMAGAKVTSITSISSGISTKFEQIGKLLKKVPGETNMVEVQEVLPLFAKELANVIYDSSETTLLKGLETLGIVNKTGHYGEAIDAVIVLGGTNDGNSNLVKTLDIPIMNFFRDREVMVIGAEPSRVIHSYATHYQSHAEIVIDNIDMIPGQVALVWSLTGIPGYYGVKTGALELLPAIQAGN